jgi:hypothetical protein
MDGHSEIPSKTKVVQNPFPRLGKGAIWAATLALLWMGGATSLNAQGLFSTLTGTVVDQSAAVIPRAEVVLRDENTGATRRTQTNDAGFFTFTNLPPTTYTLTVEREGFARWERPGITLFAGDRINIPDIVLPVAAVTQEVRVEAAPEAVIPVDSGEKSSVITSKQIQNLSVVGRSAVELLKIIPGTVFTGGRYGDTGGEVIAFNEGIGNYNVAGTRNDALDIISDGANVIDPGCNCGSAVTPNVDLVQEVKVQTANFSAENTKGPVVINTVSKSGTSEFHGEAYFYTRHHKFNTQDWRANRFNTDKPRDTYQFPGFNIGGPLTKRRDKAFFFAGVEWMRQNIDLGVWPSWVPTAAMRQGDFTDVEGLAALGGYDITRMPMNDEEQAADGVDFNPARHWGASDPLTSEMLSGGVISPGAIDPGGLILLNQYPLPNRNPAENNGFNFVSSIVNPQHRNQQLVRIDYNISDNTKLYTRFNHEGETQPYPYTLWWNNANQVPTASRVIGENRSFSTSTSLVNVLNPTTTNEVVFAATRLELPNVYENPEKVSRSATGYPYQGIFKNDVDVLPSVTDWSGGVGTMIQPGGFDPVLFANKWLISAGDNFTAVRGTHMLKFGAFFQLTTNDQPTSAVDQAWLVPTQWGGVSTGNAYADLLMGRIGWYEEFTQNIVGNMAQREFSFYAQDNWKATRRLTLELGARFYHYGWMYDKHGYIAGFDPSKYDPNAPISDYTGVVAAYLGDDIPRSGFKTPFLRIGPRFGWAYDLTGKGNTVLRGGIGQFYYRDQGNVQFGAIGNPPLQRNIQLGYAAGTLASFDQVDPSQNVPRSGLNVLDYTDDRVPTTYSWSLTLSQRLPSATVLEASYVGNTSRNQVTTDQYNINVVPEGAMFGFPLGTDEDNYRPYLSYGAIRWKSHLLSQHYHSLQVTANRQTGRINYSLAYTFGKALGISGAFYGRNADSFDRRGRSYGVLDYDRTHSLAIAYNILLPDPARTRVIREFVNGWQISGITQFQSGAPMGSSGTGFQLSGSMEDGTSISAINVAGTPDTFVAAHMLCDPRKGVDKSVAPGDAGRQYANPACFGAPSQGRNGNYQYPYLKQPAFQNHDVSVFKNFALSQTNENLKLQFRFSMYNFLNHPIPFFQGGDAGLQLSYTNGVLNQSSLENFGRPSLKRGRRLMQFALKFMF